MFIQDYKIKILGLKLMYDLGEIDKKTYDKEVRRYECLINDIDEHYIANNRSEFTKYGVMI